MTLKTSMVLTILGLTCISELAMAQGNLVINGNFDDYLNGWTSTGGFWNPKNGFPAPDFDFSASVGRPLSQTISNLNVGSLYTVSGNFGTGGTDHTTISFQVSLDGVPYFETAVPDPTNTWPYSFNFEYTATSSSAVLSFTQVASGDLINPYSIDNIAMYAVPEPGSLCLLGVGGMISAMFFRNRRQGF